MKKVLKFIGVMLLAIIVIVVIVLFVLSKLAAYRNAHYYENAAPAGEIEKKYTAMGPMKVDSFVYETEEDRLKKIEVWFPVDMKEGPIQYPLVIMANGTGIKASVYKEVFQHLASWGFIVAGNEDENSWDGSSSSETLDYMLQNNEATDSIFYQHIDTKHIGIAGHSQGGVGAINAVTDQDNGNMYTTMWTASTTFHDLSVLLQWPYDVSKVSIPYMMVAGTKSSDAGDGKDNAGIAPLSSLNENFEAISNSIPKVMAREKNMEHGDMLRYADGYMTAWFMYYLKGYTAAGTAFFGENAELPNNPNWQDVRVNE